jgi:hypothetical protein
MASGWQHGVRVRATFLNEQVSVCLACLLIQHSKNPGDFTSLIQKLFLSCNLRMYYNTAKTGVQG